MITTIRNQFKQVTYRYVIFLLVSVIALSMVSSIFIKTERAGVSWAIRVNGSEISYRDFAREVAKQTEYLAHIKAQYGQYADLLFQSLGWSFNPKSRALDILIKEELIKQYANKLGITLHADYINKVLNNANFVKQHLGHIVPPFVFDQAGMLDMNILKAFLRQHNITAKQFEKNIETALLQQQVLDFIAASSYVPSFDVKQEFMTKHCNKQFSYLTFSFDHYLTEEKKKSVSDEELQTFYDAQNIQLRRYWVPEERKGFKFIFKPEHYNIVVSDEEIQEYYEDNKVKSYVLDPLRVEVQQLFLKPIAEAANKSEDEISQAILSRSTEYEKYWKTLKPFSRGERKGELEKQAFVLQKEGEMSSVFESKQGKSIIRLVKRIPRTYKPLVSIKKDIENILIQKAFKKNFVKDLKKIVTQDNTQAMESFIAEKSGKKEAIPNTAKDDTQLSQQLFSLKKGQYGFFVENGIGMAVQLTDIIEKHLPDFASIKDVVKNDFYENKAHKALETKVVEAQKKAETQSFDALRTEFDATLNTTDMINSQDHKKLQELSKKGLPVHEMINLEKEGSILLHKGERNNVLIKLQTIEPFDESRFLSLEKEVKDHLGPIRSRLLLDAFVASLHRNATIETNESILITSEDYSE
jgi:hypothetical protein